MNFSYKFSNLLGCVYRCGNLAFTTDGDSVVSPVGNRVTRFDLKNSKSETFAIESRLNIVCVALSPDGFSAVFVDEGGGALLCSLISKTVLHHFSFNRPVSCVKYSPDGKKLAVTKENVALVYTTPCSTSREFNPLMLHRTYYGAYDETTCIDWTSDSKAFAVGSKDMNTRVFAVDDTDQLIVYSLAGHKDCIVACFFELNSLDLYTMSRRADLIVWECDTDLDVLQPTTEDSHNPRKKKGRRKTIGTEEEEDEIEKQKQRENKIKYRRTAKHFYNKSGDFDDLTCADYHKKNRILVAGFASGVFHLHEMPDYNLIHTLSISEQRVASVVFNGPGDWIAFGCLGLGQLLVWEWQSESYVLKQQGHFNNMTCLDYSRDGLLVATGAEDGKVKIWNLSSGFCFVTFSEHSGGVSGVCFNEAGKVIVSASLDGTVRAFDLHRYRNFRTLTSPQPVQFSCLALDSSGEIVCAAGQDVFEIFMWSMQTGRLLEVLSGHEAPVSGLSFGPSGSQLASSSWDKTVRLWDIFGHKGSRETLRLSSDGMCVAVSPSGEQLAVATLDYQITFWDIQNAVQTGSIEGKQDLGSGRRRDDVVTAKTSSAAKSFTTLCYSADGCYILAAGRSKHICIYHIQEQLLVKKFEISCNMSLDGMEEFLSRRNMTDFGNAALIDMNVGEEGQQMALSLPGVTKGDMSSRSFRPEVNVSCVRFSATGSQWAATTTEGLLVYSVDSSLTFDPYDLTLDLTPAAVFDALKEEEWSKALMMAFRLNEKMVIQRVTESIPWSQVDVICSSIADTYVEKMLSFVAEQLTASPHLEFYVLWAEKLLSIHGSRLKLKNSSSHHAMLTALQKSLITKADTIGKICNTNRYTLQYLQTLAKLQPKKRKLAPLGSEDDDKETEEDEEEEESLGDGEDIDSDDSETQITPLL
ncbi:periodic tryptophan protein 2 homolog [Lytechinus pictus]|uniref:periodic tryptophan protein 2 homolog n=1 Tax=Lytechinus pictus TaxID=7653 RepID=UPI0030B9DAAE